MVKTHFRKRLWIIPLLIAGALALTACRADPPAAVTVLLDGKAVKAGSIAPEEDDDLRVYITHDGEALIDLPFGEAHRVSIVQKDGEENHVVLTGDAVYMESANCENQDCIQMGEVTRENHELRVMGGFIICLPHRISVEVRGD